MSRRASLRAFACVAAVAAGIGLTRLRRVMSNEEPAASATTTAATTAPETTAPATDRSGHHRSCHHEAEEPAAETLEIPVADTGLVYAVTEAEAPAGEVTIESKNPQAVPHDIAIDATRQGRRRDRHERWRLEDHGQPHSGTYTYYAPFRGTVRPDGKARSPSSDPRRDADRTHRWQEGHQWVVRLASPWPRDRSVFAPPARHARARPCTHVRSRSTPAHPAGRYVRIPPRSRTPSASSRAAIAPSARASSSVRVSNRRQRVDAGEEARLALVDVCRCRRPRRWSMRASPTVRCPSAPISARAVSAAGSRAGSSRSGPWRAGTAAGAHPPRTGARGAALQQRDMSTPVQGEEQAAGADELVRRAAAARHRSSSGASAARVRRRIAAGGACPPPRPPRSPRRGRRSYRRRCAMRGCGVSTGCDAVAHDRGGEQAGVAVADVAFGHRPRVVRRRCRARAAPGEPATVMSMRISFVCLGNICPHPPPRR